MKKTLSIRKLTCNDFVCCNFYKLFRTRTLYWEILQQRVTFYGPKVEEIYQWYADNCKKGYFSFNTIGRYSSEDLANEDIASFSGSCVNDQYIQMVEGKGEFGMAKWIAGDFYTAWNRSPIILPVNWLYKLDGSHYIDTDDSRECTLPLDVQIPLTKELVHSLYTEYENRNVILDYVIDYFK